MPKPETPPPTAEELRRLSLARHLYGQGVTQSRGPEPTAGLSILSFHDAAELFLQLASERYQAGDIRPDFMQYWALLAKKNVVLPQREAMQRLNAARIGLKHQGILPAQVELEGFRAAVTNFLYDSTPLLFGIDFDKISQVNLVSDTAAREKLKEGYAALEAIDHHNALGSAAVAFILVKRAHNQKLADAFPPHKPTSLSAWASGNTFRPSISRAVGRTLGDEVGRTLRQIAESSDRTVEILSEAIEMIGYGLDLRDYRLYVSHIPVVHQFVGGKMEVEWMQQPTQDSAIVGRCLDFVVQAAARLGV